MAKKPEWRVLMFAASAGALLGQCRVTSHNTRTANEPCLEALSTYCPTGECLSYEVQLQSVRSSCAQYRRRVTAGRCADGTRYLDRHHMFGNTATYCDDY